MALATNPNNYYLLVEHSRQLIQAEKWEEAIESLNKVLDHFPNQPGNEVAPRLLAQAFRGQGDLENEIRVLREIADFDHEAPDVYLRLIALDTADEKWDAVHQNIQRVLAVNPLIPQPYRHLARTSEALGEPAKAIGAYRTLIQLDPADPADVHFQLARLLHDQSNPEAHAHVIKALEEAPRYRDAYRLLLAINAAAPFAGEAPPNPEPEANLEPEPTPKPDEIKERFF